MVEENKSTGRGQKTEFKELEVNNYDSIMPLYAFLKSWSKHIMRELMTGNLSLNSRKCIRS